MSDFVMLNKSLHSSWHEGFLLSSLKLGNWMSHCDPSEVKDVLIIWVFCSRFPQFDPKSSSLLHPHMWSWLSVYSIGGHFYEKLPSGYLLGLSFVWKARIGCFSGMSPLWDSAVAWLGPVTTHANGPVHFDAEVGFFFFFFLTAVQGWREREEGIPQFHVNEGNCFSDVHQGGFWLANTNNIPSFAWAFSADQPLAPPAESTCVSPAYLTQTISRWQ